MESVMELIVKFCGGPAARLVGVVGGLDEMRVFDDAPNQSLHVYRRDPCIDELTYIYDREASSVASAKYEEAKKFYLGLSYSDLRFLEE